MGPPAAIEMPLRSWDFQLFEENSIHIVVEMLSCMENKFLDGLIVVPVMVGDCPADYRCFDKLWTGAYDGDNFHLSDVQLNALNKPVTASSGTALLPKSSMNLLPTIAPEAFDVAA